MLDALTARPADRAANVTVVVVICALAAFHVLISLATAGLFQLEHPLQDEFRVTYRYLTLPFPDSILASENGHHPVLPGLVRWIELHWMGGRRGLQAMSAWGAFGLALFLISREVVQGLKSRGFQTVAAALVLALLLWNANARMFFHAHEAAHLFFVIGATAVAMASALKAGHGSAAWWGAAWAACALALLSFGPGVGAFAAVMAIALLRRSSRALAMTTIVFAICLVAYMWALPGGADVRNTVAAGDLVSAAFFWLVRMGVPFAELTRHKVTVCLAASLFSVVMITSLARLWLLGHRFSRLELMGAALFGFSAAANAAIVAGRTTYFFEHPEQLFSERFLFWSCVGWAGMGLFAVAKMDATSGRRQWVPGILLLLLLAAMIPPAKRWHAWAATRNQEVELAALALRLDIEATALVQKVTDAATFEAYDYARALRRTGVGDIGAEGTRLGSRLPIGASPDREIAASVAETGSARLSIVSFEMPDLPRGRLWLTDENGVVIGAAAVVPALIARASWLRIVPKNFVAGLVTGERRAARLVEATDSGYVQRAVVCVSGSCRRP